MLEVSLTSDPDVIEVRLEGRLDGVGAAALDRELPAVRADHDVILDVGGVSYLSSAGVRSLLRLAQGQRTAGRALVLTGLAPQVGEILELSGLLGELEVAPSPAQARTLLRSGARGASTPSDVLVGDRRYSVSLNREARSELVVWGDWRSPASPPEAASGSVLLTLEELGLAWGVAALAGNREQALASYGAFVSTPGLLAVRPADGVGEPDDLAADRPAEATAFVLHALALAGTAGWRVATSAVLTLRELLDDCRVLAAGDDDAPPILGYAVLARWVDGPARVAHTSADLLASEWPEAEIKAGEAVLLVGLTIAREHAGKRGASSLALLHGRGPECQPGGALFSCHGLRLAELPATDGADVLAAIRQLVARDGHRGVVRLDPEARVEAARGVIFAPARVVAGEEALPQIAVNSGAPLSDEWQVITRRIYADSGRVALTELTGGYSATTYQAESWDRADRRTIPTVLKIATRDFTEREERAYHEHVKPFILNNSTVIMGRANQGPWAGLRYNFVGITGSGSRLTWLADHYRGRPFDEIAPILEAVFGTVLWPWYGQSHAEELALYQRHDPARIFPRIPEDGAAHLGVDPEAETIACREFGRTLPNPYYLLRHDLRERFARRRRWPVAITHGDLNLSNILLDEKENIYVIDFSETGPRNAVADFARIEPMIALELTRLASGADFAALLDLFAGMVSVSRLDEPPPFRYSGDDPMVEKAHRTVCLLRRCATRTVAPETDLLPYLLPLLEWTMPIVSYRQVSARLRRLSMLCSALICERILELDP